LILKGRLYLNQQLTSYPLMYLI